MGPKTRNRRRFWLILGLVGALILALCGGCGGTLYWAISSQLAPSQAGATVLYKSSLRDADSAWPSQSDHCVYAAAGYVVDGGVCLGQTSAFDDFDLSVTVAQASGATAGFYGVLFRQHGGLNSYLFDISTAGQWRFRRIAANAYFPDQPNEQIFVLPKSDAFIRTGGATNILLIHAVGGRFTFYANNFKLGEVDDSGGYASGQVGFIATAGAVAVFTDLLITAPRH